METDFWAKPELLMSVIFGQKQQETHQNVPLLLSLCIFFYYCYFTCVKFVLQPFLKVFHNIAFCSFLDLLCDFDTI